MVAPSPTPEEVDRAFRSILSVFARWRIREAAGLAYPSGTADGEFLADLAKRVAAFESHRVLSEVPHRRGKTPLPVTVKHLEDLTSARPLRQRMTGSIVHVRQLRLSEQQAFEWFAGLVEQEKLSVSEVSLRSWVRATFGARRGQAKPSVAAEDLLRRAGATSPRRLAYTQKREFAAVHELLGSMGTHGELGYVLHVMGAKAEKIESILETFFGRTRMRRRPPNVLWAENPPRPRKSTATYPSSIAREARRIRNASQDSRKAGAP